MIKLWTKFNPSNFMLLHLDDPKPKLAVGSTIYFDKQGNYENIPLDTLVADISRYYTTTFRNVGDYLIWTVTGFADICENS